MIQGHRTAKPNRFPQHSAYRGTKAAHLNLGKLTRGQLWRNPRAKQRFTGVDVPHPRHKLLIHQLDFDRLGGSFQGSNQIALRKLARERLGPEFIQDPKLKCEASEVTLVLIDESFAAKIKDNSGMFGQSRSSLEQEDSARHPQMTDHLNCRKLPSPTQVEDQIFTAAREAAESGAEECAFEGSDIRRGENFWPKHLQTFDPLVPDQRPQVLHKDFDFWQFRHSGMAQ